MAFVVIPLGLVWPFVASTGYKLGTAQHPWGRLRAIEITEEGEDETGLTETPKPEKKATDWCAHKLQCVVNYKTVHNTMCQFPLHEPSSTCAEFSNKQTDDHRALIVTLHNRLRTLVTSGEFENWPPAADMRRIAYDMFLEEMAYHWAKECSLKLNDCRKTPEWSAIGQNLNVSYSDENPDNVDVISPFDAWHSQYKSLPSKALDQYMVTQGTVHFAQLIFAQTTRIGCADVVYAVPKGPKKYLRVYVCNYGSGIDPGMSSSRIQLYHAGLSCSMCSNKSDCTCTSEELGSTGSRETNAGCSRPAVLLALPVLMLPLLTSPRFFFPR